MCKKNIKGRYRQGGFTLMELMITIVIVGILLAVALPSFQNQVRKGHRAAAQAEMMDIVNRQQQFLLSDRTYVSKAVLEATGYSLASDVADRYDYGITLGVGTVPSFTMTFTAKGSQAKDGNLSITSEGVKSPAGKW